MYELICTADDLVVVTSHMQLIVSILLSALFSDTYFTALTGASLKQLIV